MKRKMDLFAVALAELSDTVAYIPLQRKRQSPWTVVSTLTTAS
jgi:hypothetical protein